jgi:hypothetical protein
MRVVVEQLHVTRPHSSVGMTMKILLSVLCTIALPALARVVMKQERTNHVLSVLPFKLKPVTFQWDNCSK